MIVAKLQKQNTWQKGDERKLKTCEMLIKNATPRGV